jgi:transcriptional regulator with XRE-family HTH domain
MNRLAIYRKRKDISQEELAKKLGVSKTNISAWENGTRAIPLKHHDKLVAILGLTEAELLNAVSDSVFLTPECRYSKTDDAIELFRRTALDAIMGSDELTAEAKITVYHIINELQVQNG